jgi:DNA-binding LytR/AlgR family response regulator
MKWKAIIADDEKPLRDYLRKLLLRLWPELTVCGEASDGNEALSLVEAHRPHIAFLDIRMPGLSGMEVAERIAGICRIVFVTAYDRYAVEAFEKEAVDYLLKPVNEERLEKALKRLKKEIQKRPLPDPDNASAAERLLDILKNQPPPSTLQWIKVMDGQSVRLISVDEIFYFQASDKYTVVQTKNEEHLIKKSIRELAGELDPGRFWRIHRATLVNAARIEKVTRSLTGRGIIHLKDRAETLTVSRSYLHLFKQM